MYAWYELLARDTPAMSHKKHADTKLGMKKWRQKSSETGARTHRSIFAALNSKFGRIIPGERGCEKPC